MTGGSDMGSGTHGDGDSDPSGAAGAGRDRLALVGFLAACLAVSAAAAFRPIDRMAGWLMVPYAAWVLFATVLNAALWTANPEALLENPPSALGRDHRLM